MPKVVFIGPDGARTEIEVSAGTSLMRAATQSGLRGIVGECGGVMSCATCHVLVDPEFVGLLPPPSETEDGMLDFTATARQPGSRLSCQVEMSEALDGLTVRIVAAQT